MLRTRPKWSGAVALSLAVLGSFAPVAAQTAQTDTTRSGGFQGPGSSETTIAEDSKPKVPFVRIPMSSFEPWQETKARVQESIGQGVLLCEAG